MDSVVNLVQFYRVYIFMRVCACLIYITNIIFLIYDYKRMKEYLFLQFTYDKVSIINVSPIAWYDIDKQDWSNWMKGFSSSLSWNSYISLWIKYLFNRLRIEFLFKLYQKSISLFLLIYFIKYNLNYEMILNLRKSSFWKCQKVQWEFITYVKFSINY